MSYVDKNGMYHDKVVKGGAPSSNNGFYYTAVAKKLGLAININEQYAIDCASKRVRRLDKKYPPISRDEILGLVELGFYDYLKIKNWNFSPFKLPKFKLLTFIYQLVLAISHRHDRNFFWQQELDQLYVFAFSVPISDRYYIQKKTNQKINLLYYLVHFFDSKIKYKKRSQRLMRWFKYKKDENAVIHYFGVDHVFSLNLVLNRDITMSYRDKCQKRTTERNIRKIENRY